MRPPVNGLRDSSPAGKIQAGVDENCGERAVYENDGMAGLEFERLEMHWRGRGTEMEFGAQNPLAKERNRDVENRVKWTPLPIEDCEHFGGETVTECDWVKLKELCVDCSCHEGLPARAGLR